MKISAKTIQWLLLSVAAFIFFAANAPAFAQLAPLQIPYIDEWVASPHAWHSREAFTHWNDEGEIPPGLPPLSWSTVNPGFPR